MKRRDAIKAAIGSVLGFACASLVAKAVEPEAVYFKGVRIETVPKMDTKVFITHTFQLKQRPYAVLSDYR